MRRYFWPKRFKRDTQILHWKRNRFFFKVANRNYFLWLIYQYSNLSAGENFYSSTKPREYILHFLNPSLIFRFQPTPKVADSYTIKAFTPVAHGYHFLKYWNHSIGEEVCTCYYSSKKKLRGFKFSYYSIYYMC